MADRTMYTYQHEATYQPTCEILCSFKFYLTAFRSLQAATDFSNRSDVRPKAMQHTFQTTWTEFLTVL